MGEKMKFKNVTVKTIFIEGKEVASGEIIELEEKKCKGQSRSYIRMGYLVPVEEMPTETKKPKHSIRKKRKLIEEVNTMEVD